MMMSGKTFKSVIKSLYIVAFAAPFLLSACAGSIEPGPIPTGYKYHQGTYKGPAGAEPTVFDENTAGSRHAQVKELAPDGSGAYGNGAASDTVGISAEAVAWLPASRELIERIKGRLGYPVEPTFFEGMNGKYIPGFETALKTATSEQGWPAAATKGSGPFHLAYSAAPADPSDPGRLLLTVRLTVSKSNFVIEESGIYTIAQGPVVTASPADPVTLSPIE